MTLQLSASLNMSTLPDQIVFYRVSINKVVTVLSGQHSWNQGYNRGGMGGEGKGTGQKEVENFAQKIHTNM